VSDIQLNDPQTLYRRWEDSQWSPFDVDVSTDKQQWPGIQPDVQQSIYLLRQAVAEDPAMADVIRAQIRELLPAVAESISPPRECGTCSASRTERSPSSPWARSTGVLH
jgi:ribonucleotide reductase beta subunit family protein with ferritin-like domain